VELRRIRLREEVGFKFRQEVGARDGEEWMETGRVGVVH